ncbi:NAD-dependent epimerase [Compostibacter hankyongensis]|uniref:NAD-dependent epimerase n=1 Tax=Compostibacter hankyongensis TaxID=1007089 RepID=A0ABP8G8N7_9BACT
MKILVTGCAGFIGFHLVQALLHRGETVVGIDNINDYYDINLKYDRLEALGIGREHIYWYKIVEADKSGFRFCRINLEDRRQLLRICEKEGFDVIVHLAAQAGVRYSIQHPDTYIQSNLVGFLNILEVCREIKVRHLVYASSSSVYGLNECMPFSVRHNVDHPVSLYGASKKSNELMAHAYSHLFGIPTSGLRFFTVYGPWGRPDMAYFLFAEAITKGEPIKVFNHGEMKRDFTYVDDIIRGLICVMDEPAGKNAAWSGQKPDPSSSSAPYRIYNIGNHTPVRLLDFIATLEQQLGKDARKEFVDMQSGDVPATWADVDDLIENFDYRPETPVAEGLSHFVGWYKSYYKIS